MKQSMMKFLLVVALLLPGLLWGQTFAQVGGNVNSDASVEASHGKSQTSGSMSGSSSASSQASANAGLAAGTTFNAALVTSLDSRKTQAGSEVVARTTENVRSEGKTILPKGTKLLGHVTRSSARAKGDADSTLAIAFDHAVLKNGQEISLNLSIQALASAQSSASASDADINTMADAGAGMASSGVSRSRGVLGGTTAAAGGTVAGIADNAGRIGNTTDAAANSSLASGGLGRSSPAIGGLDAAGQLTSNSRGVFNLSSLSLGSQSAASASGSVVTSTGKNVHLDTSTRLLLATQSTTSRDMK